MCAFSEGSFLEPDRVWPFSAGITALTVSRFSSLLAIGLENGCVVLWDIYFGKLFNVHVLKHFFGKFGIEGGLNFPDLWTQVKFMLEI